MQQDNKKISVIILTFNEEMHIERCIQSAKKYSDFIYIVDSFSTDKTVSIAKSHNVNILQNKFVNYSHQFSWALNNINFKTDWIMRLDADEYLSDELINEMNSTLKNINNEIVGINFKRRHIFMNRWIKHGGRYPLILLRLWRKNLGQIEKRWMDEHIIIKKGKTITLKNFFSDHNLKNLSFFIKKHDWYASREAIDIILLSLKKNINELNVENSSLNASIKRNLKENLYNYLPIGLRPFLYFLYRYFFLLGFLDGKEGFIYHFLQGFWYRFIVDCKLIEFKKEIKNLNNYDDILKKLAFVSGLNIK